MASNYGYTTEREENSYEGEEKTYKWLSSIYNKRTVVWRGDKSFRKHSDGSRETYYFRQSRFDYWVLPEKLPDLTKDNADRLFLDAYKRDTAKKIIFIELKERSRSLENMRHFGLLPYIPVEKLRVFGEQIKADPTREQYYVNLMTTGSYIACRITNNLYEKLKHSPTVIDAESKTPNKEISWRDLTVIWDRTIPLRLFFNNDGTPIVPIADNDESSRLIHKMIPDKVKADAREKAKSGETPAITSFFKKVTPKPAEEAKPVVAESPKAEESKLEEHLLEHITSAKRPEAERPRHSTVVHHNSSASPPLGTRENPYTERPDVPKVGDFILKPDGKFETWNGVEYRNKLLPKK